MNNEIKEILEFDHFKDLEELKRNVECWIETDEMYWERWFGLRDIKILLDYITNLQQIEQDHQKLNGELREENKKLQEEKDKFKLRCYKSLKLIRDNYGVLDKYGIDMLDDILIGGDK